MSLTTLYFLTVLPNLGEFLSGIAAIGSLVMLFAMVICGMATADGYFERYPLKGVIASWAILLVLGLTSALLPTERQLYIIAGGYFATNNEAMKELPDNLLNAVNDWLKVASEKAKEIK